MPTSFFGVGFFYFPFHNAAIKRCRGSAWLCSCLWSGLSSTGIVHFVSFYTVLRDKEWALQSPVIVIVIGWYYFVFMKLYSVSEKGGVLSSCVVYCQFVFIMFRDIGE